MRDKVRTYEMTITEVSGIGLRIEMSEELAIGETIRLFVNDYHMFAQVRRCVPSESGFIIGLERIDAWNGPPPGSALMAPKTATASQVKELGRPKLKKPLDNLHAAALRTLFTDSRWRTKQKKYQAIFIIAGCVALAGWAGFGAGFSLHGKPQGAAVPKAESAKQLPGAPKSSATIAPPKSATTVVVAPLQTAAVVAPLLQKDQVVAPPVQKAAVVALPALKAVVAAPPAQKAQVVASPVQKAVIPAPPPTSSSQKLPILRLSCLRCAKRALRNLRCKRPWLRRRISQHAPR